MAERAKLPYQPAAEDRASLISPGSAVTARVVFEGERLVVVDKPSGPTSEATAAELGRRLVHRIDRLTSGLLLLADDARTVTRLQRALQRGLVERWYRFVAHGRLAPQELHSTLVEDRGDGLRGSDLRSRDLRSRGNGGKPASCQILDCVVSADGRTTTGSARLVTGRTHQLRIQLAEAGHPLVGEPVYIRDARRDGLTLLPSPRLMLHAARLRFAHPNTHLELDLEAMLPAAFTSSAGNLGPSEERADLPDQGLVERGTGGGSRS